MATTLNSLVTQLTALTAAPSWEGVEIDGYYCLDDTGVDRGQRIHRRFGLLQAVFFARTGNPGAGLLDTEMAAVLGLPLADARQLRAASLAINCKREEAPAHVRGQLKAALKLSPSSVPQGA